MGETSMYMTNGGGVSKVRRQDRTREHLGTTDKGIIAYRKNLLMAEIRQRSAAGERPLLDLDADARNDHRAADH